MYIYAKKRIIADTDVEDMREIQNLYKQLYVDPNYGDKWEFLGPEDKLSRQVNELCLSAYMKYLKESRRFTFRIRGWISFDSRNVKFEIDLENTGRPYPHVYARIPIKSYYKMVYLCAKSSDSYNNFVDKIYSWMNNYAKYYEVDNDTNYKSLSWDDIKSKIDEDVNEYGNIFYHSDESSIGNYIESAVQKVEEKLGIFVEPNVQLGSGSVSVYDSNTDDLLFEEDYETWYNDLIDLVYDSTSLNNYSTKVKKYYVNKINQL